MEAASDPARVALALVGGTPVPENVTRAVSHPRAGGVATFVGLVRDHDGGKGVARLDYASHPTAQEGLAALAGQIAATPGVVAVAAHHATGELAVGDIAVVAAVAAEHRAEAFAACQLLVDRLKAEVPIWKHQVFADGSDEWVGVP